MSFVKKLYALLRSFTDLLLYGNFWIAAGASAMAIVSLYLTKGNWEADHSVGFLFFSTLLVYSLHRIVGLQKAKGVRMTERYKIIERYKQHIVLYAVLSVLGCLYFFFQMQIKTQLFIVGLGLVSIAYVLPVFKGKRLRDFNFVKVFVVALTWSAICCLMPLVNAGHDIGWVHYLYFAENIFFVFAITLPFDIRDMKLDDFVGVKTLVISLGKPKSFLLVRFALGIAFLLSVGLSVEKGDMSYAISRFIIYLFLFFYVPRLKEEMNDYYFSGVLDGTLILGPLLLILMHLIFGGLM